MTVLSFREPVESLLNLQRELDQFFRRPLGVDFGTLGVYPPTNIFTDKDGLVIRAEVPGISPDALTVSLERTTLTISGERKRDLGSNGSVHRRERQVGKFSRSLRLPQDFDVDQASAECRDGVLTVRIPKRAETKPRQVQIKAA